MSIRIERIGSIEKIGEYRRYQIAVNGFPCVPVWMCEPEFQAHESLGEDGLWNRLALAAVTQTRNELPLSDRDNEALAGAFNEIAQRR